MGKNAPLSVNNLSREIQVKMVFKLENVYIIYPKIPDMHMELKNRSMSHHMVGGLIPKWRKEDLD